MGSLKRPCIANSAGFSFHSGGPRTHLTACLGKKTASDDPSPAHVNREDRGKGICPPSQLCPHEGNGIEGIKWFTWSKSEAGGFLRNAPPTHTQLLSKREGTLKTASVKMITHDVCESLAQCFAGTGRTRDPVSSLKTFWYSYNPIQDLVGLAQRLLGPSLPPDWRRVLYIP